MSLMLRKWILNSIIKSKPAKKPIAQLNRIENFSHDSQLHGHIKLACISDKEKFIRAVFTNNSLAPHELASTSFDDMKGGLISLQDYAMIASIGTDRRYSEYFVEIHKFSFIGGERNMPIPTVTNVNFDEKVQSKLAQLWREAQLDDADNGQYSALTVYSQIEDSPQLSQDELSMLLVLMSEQSQVYSIEAISSSQLFELENIPGWVKPEKDPLSEGELSLTQETEYGTPLVGTRVTVLSESDESSHDTTATFKTPPQGITSQMITNENSNQQQVYGGQVQPIYDTEQPLDHTIIPPHYSGMLTSLQSKETIQCITPVQVSVKRAEDMNRVLEQTIQNAPEMLSKSTPISAQMLRNQSTIDDGEAVHESPVAGRDMDDLFYGCEISCSQVEDLNAVWSEEQPSVETVSGVTTNKQPCSSSSDILVASDTPNNRHNCNNNDINNNDCPEQNTAALNKWQEEDKRKGKQYQSEFQQVAERKQHTDKGKGGTTKNIHLIEDLVTTNSRTETDTCYDLMDNEISISSSQQDELDKQWVDEAINSTASSIETIEDLHPFQLVSLPNPAKKTISIPQLVTEATDNEPGPSNIATLTANNDNSDYILNQEVNGNAVINDGDMDIDSSDQHLLSQAETEGGTPSASANMQTSLVSTAAITRLLDVSNKIPSVNDTISTKVVTGNTQLTPQKITSEIQPEPVSEEDIVFPKQSVVVTNGDSYVSSDVVNSKQCLDGKLTYQFTPLITEEDIDEFINNYWMLHRLRNFSF